MWKTFSRLCRLSAVAPLCRDAACDSCGASSCAAHTYQHLRGKAANWTQCWLSCRSCYKKGGFLANGTNHSRRMTYRLGWLSVTVRILVPSKAPFSDPPISCRTLCWPPNCRWLVAVLPQDNVELHFDLFFTAFYWWLGGWQSYGNIC